MRDRPAKTSVTKFLFQQPCMVFGVFFWLFEDKNLAFLKKFLAPGPGQFRRGCMMYECQIE